MTRSCTSLGAEREDYWDYRLPDGWEKYLGTEQPRSRMTTRELMREEKGYRLQTGIKSQTSRF